MNKLSIVLITGLLTASTQAVADDTEIYGATAIDENRKVNSNVLLIVDNSGSMRGNVTYFNADYDPNFNYSGNYNRSEFFLSENAQNWQGIPLSSLQSGLSTSCTETINTLNATGKITGQYQQRYWSWRSGWRWSSNVNHNSNEAVRCETNGSSRTLHSGNYMNYYHDSSNRVVTNRMEVVKKIVKDLTYSLKDVNIGMMRFDTSSTGGAYHDGGMIEVAIDDIKNNAQTIRDTVATYQHETNTPLSETLFEAYRYYSGGNVAFGNVSEPLSSADSRSASNTDKYESPIKHECQKNHVIMLTDGDPTQDVDANSAIKSLISGMDLPSGLSHSCSGNGGCMAELAYYMNNVDVNKNDDFLSKQVVSTYTVGAFGGISDTDLLKKTAGHGGGQYYAPENPDALSEAINSIFLDILAQDSTFTAPAISVNAFNNSEHRDELFYALFKPNDKAKWFGNLKKFRLGKDDGKIYDKNNNLAIDTSTGYFSKSSQDYWSQSSFSDADTKDGKDVTLGGAANLLNPNHRKLYSENNSNNLDFFNNIANAATLNVDNSVVDNLKLWTAGFDVKDDPSKSRYYIGDPLHSEPVVVTYGGTKDNPDSTIYFGTNEGFIHAVNTDTGAEEFSFIPKELHEIQNIYYEDNTPAGSRPYGMDGPITTWMYDINSNNVIYNELKALEPNEHVYLYAGMRRGGRNYYALDVTNRNSPKMLFKIEGGVTPGFEKLGQTWSKMTIAKVKFSGADKFVLFFTGGYDVNQDGNTLTEDDTVGNAVYMVDATDGTLLWTASNENADLEITDMVDSIPASLAAIDITGEGNVDYLFAADAGGRVFRFDINQNNSGATNFANGGVIASLAENDAVNNRRFYNKPNVSLIKDKQYGDHLTIAIGSGHRAHPILNKTEQNRFYLIRDFYPYKAPTSYQTKTEAPLTKSSLADGENADLNKLYNATTLMTEGESALTNGMRQLMSRGGGWYVTFSNEGEKVLSESTTFAGAVIFTTFSPSSSTVIGCGPDTGQSRTYALNQTNAMSVIDLDGDGDLDANDSSVTLAQSGIAPRPIVIYRPKGKKTIAIGTETIEDNRFEDSPYDPKCEENNSCPEEKGNRNVIPEYWRQNETIQ